MKQRTIFPLLAVTALMSLAACSSDDELAQEPEGQPTTSTITVAVPGDFAATRADGTTSSAASGYKNTGKATIYLAMYNSAASKVLWSGSKEISGDATAATFSVSGIRGQKVQFVAYATVGDQNLGDNWDLKNISLPANTLNNENLDAFSKAEEGVFGTTEGITLTRTGCKVRLVATDWAAASEAGVTVNKVEVTATGDSKLQPWSQFNAVEAAFSTDNTLETLTATAIPAYTDEESGDNKTMFTDYIPVNDGAEVNTPLTVKVTYTVDGNEVTREINLTNIPVKRNRLVTIKGKVFTTSSDFNVSFTDDFGNESKVDLWDGSVAENVTETAGVYEISTGAQLAWVAQQVYSGTNTFNGKTIRLMADIDLGNQEWTPIGRMVYAPGTCFQGTFDGNDKAISNLNAVDNTENYGAAGLFGAASGATIKDLTVKNATVTSHHYAGTIVAYDNNGSTIENCTVEGATVKSSSEKVNGSWDNGDKAGGVVGYGVKTTIKDCTVSSTSITGYRDLGGIIGCASGESTVSGCKLVMGKDAKDNTISTVTIDVDRSHNYMNYGYGYQADNNAGAYIGRNENSTSSNNSGVVTIYYPKVLGNVDVVFDGDSFDHYGSTGGYTVPVGEGSVETQG